jgi:hypothetical protein
MLVDLADLSLDLAGAPNPKTGGTFDPTTLLADSFDSSVSQTDSVRWTLASTNTDSNLRSTPANVRCGPGVSLAVRVPPHFATANGSGTDHSFTRSGILIAMPPIAN